MDRLETALERVRALVNQPRLKSTLMKRRQNWLGLCGAMDATGDTQLAVFEYLNNPLEDDAPEALPRALSRHLDEAELGDAVERRLRLVLEEQLLEGLTHLLAVVRPLHVDEVEDDEPADVAEAELISNLFDRLQVGLECGLFNMTFSGRFS